MVSRSYAASAGIRERTPAWCVLRVAHRALSVAVPGGSGIAVLLIARDLGRVRRGASWRVVEAAAPPVGNTTPPPDPAPRGSSSRIRTTPLAWLRSPECRGCSRATSPAPSVGTWPPARAGADGPAPDEPIAVIPFLLGGMVMMKSVC